MIPNMKLFQRSNGYWYVSFGRGKKRSLKTKNKTLAKKLFKEVQKKALKGKLIFLERKETISISDFFKEYIEWGKINKSPSTVERDKWVFKRFIDYFGKDRLIQTITIKDIENFRSHLLTLDRKPSGINVDFRHLKASFNKAREWGYIEKNPFHKIKMLKEPKKAPVFISKEDMEKILKHLSQRDPEFHDFVVFVLETGARRMEALGIEREDIDFKNNFLRLKGKGNKERIIPMTRKVREILLKKYNKREGKIFNRWTIGWVTKKWKKYMKELNYNYRFHDLRHTTASWMAIKGVPIQFIQELLGHTNINITMIYAHLRPDILKEALETVFENAPKNHPVPFLTLVK